MSVRRFVNRVLGPLLGPLLGGPVLVVARRELVERARSRAFRAGTAFTLVLVVGGVALPSVLDDGPARYDVAASRRAPPALVDAVARAGEVVGAEVRVSRVGTDRVVVAAVEAERADLGLTASGERPTIVVRRDFAPGDQSRLARLVESAAALARLRLALERAGVEVEVGERAGGMVEVRALGEPVADGSRRFAAFYGVLLLFLLLVQYGGWVVNGVIEDKASRVAEVLLCTLRPRELLAGKVLGVGALALAHGLVLAGAALATGAAVGTGLQGTLSAGAVAWMAVWFLLGYALYCNLYAMAGAMVSRLEDAQTVVVMVPLMVGYLSATSVLAGGDVAPWLQVLAVVPLTAPFDMPVLIAVGQAEAWQVALSVVLMVASIVLAARLAGAVYARSILHVGRRLAWREALRAPAAGS